MRLFFLLLPWLELFTLIQLGVKTSALTALFYVLATFVLGLAVIRKQGMGMFERLRDSQDGRIVGPELFLDDMALGLAGILLMFPGMISDFAALVVMIGPLRRKVASWFTDPVAERYVPERDHSDSTTIEGDFHKIDE